MTPSRPSREAVAVDAAYPWPGLAAFTEDHEAFFHGRSTEIADLLMRVRRKPLTVLYGQSGLGKTSLLQAGLFPKLRADYLVPVPIRIDYSDDAPEPVAQILLALADALRRRGVDTDRWLTPSDSVWENLHRLETRLEDADGNALTPVLVFDQFEEVFTLGAARADAATFVGGLVEELAALVENRPPKLVEARFEQHPDLVEQFNFDAQNFRILLSLREDYLPHLHDLQQPIPSIKLNSMRLTRMHGEQALEAILGPGGHLVSPSVAEAIVRFVAGDGDADRAGPGRGDRRSLEVEPALLSLFCRGLNQERISAGASEISLDLVRGSRQQILQAFYDSCFDDQPPMVRIFVEEELLTESGYRENIAVERAERALTQRGVSPEALGVLVSRRLLRVEERLRVQRIELTHDVLAEVAKRSRSGRRQREALEEATSREAEARVRLRRARRRGVLLVGGSLVVGGALALFGLTAIRQGRIAETQRQVADTQRRAADSARAIAQSAESVAVRRATEVSALLDQLQDSAAVLGRQRDALAGQRDAIEQQRQEAEESARRDAAQLQQFCSYALSLAQTLDPSDTATRAVREATDSLYRRYLLFTNRTFDSLHSVGASGECVQQMRARMKVIATQRARGRRDTAAVLRWGGEALELVREFRGSNEVLAQRLYNDLAWEFYRGGALDAAQTAAREGLATFEPRNAGRSSHAWYRHARLYQAWGNAVVRTDREEARRIYTAALAAIDTAVQRRDQDQGALALERSQLHMRLGEADSTDRRHDGARSRYRTALQLSERRRVRWPSLAAAQWLASSHDWLGRLELALGRKEAGDGDRDGAREAERRAQEAFLGSLLGWRDTLIPEARSDASARRVYTRLQQTDESLFTPLALQRLGELLAIDSTINDGRNSSRARRRLVLSLKLLVAHAVGRQDYERAVFGQRQVVSVRRRPYEATQSATLKRTYGRDLAPELGNLAFYLLFIGQPAEAAALAIEALGLDSTQTFVYTNLAPALLMSDRVTEAAAVYQGCSTTTYGSNPERRFADVVRADTKRLVAAGRLSGEQQTQVDAWLGTATGACRIPSGLAASPDGEPGQP